MTPFLADPDVTLYHGDALKVMLELGTNAVDAIVTSPPYLDARPEYQTMRPHEYGHLFAEARRVCSGPMLLNVGRLWRGKREVTWWHELRNVAESCGWPHVDTIVWAKANANPIQGAVLSNAHEYVLLFGDPDEFDVDAVRTEYAPGSVERLRRRWVASVSVKGDTADRNGSRRDTKRGERREPNDKGARASSVFVCPTGRHKGNPHPAPMALELADYLVALSGGSTILDPFAGSGTTALAARYRRRCAVLIELELDYCELIAGRLRQQAIGAPA